ncbi:DNA polymerase III subunit chi [uncultured Pseudoteredinibacter sp.]|uniref:DNA polymerase III subunit chi n=1 Tax=uncultured Pseudoteredinibacter sp. TaxID=1641701 RepID=UPI0026273E58|nr:DNA polymerase III subunit chi [uncultured Pseudoteredinibacter sp.]
MTRVDFYILPEAGLDARHNFACRLVEKMYRLSQDVCVLTPNAQQCSDFGQRLWAYNPTSFIPHRCRTDEQSESHEQADKVWITHGDELLQHHNVLVNLSCEQPSHFSRFERLLEIVVPDEDVVQASRQRYRFYQERGYPIANHDMRR